MKQAYRRNEGSKAASRTPHGVRGLKRLLPCRKRPHAQVAPLTGCVD